MAKTFFKDENGKLTDEWVEFVDYKKMSVKKFYNLSSLANSPDKVEDFMNAIAGYILDWHIVGVNGNRLGDPKTSDWQDEISFESFSRLMEAFGSLFPS